jgi:hypothetical protein
VGYINGSAGLLSFTFALILAAVPTERKWLSVLLAPLLMIAVMVLLIASESTATTFGSIWYFYVVVLGLYMCARTIWAAPFYSFYADFYNGLSISTSLFSPSLFPKPLFAPDLRLPQELKPSCRHWRHTRCNTRSQRGSRSSSSLSSRTPHKRGWVSPSLPLLYRAGC